MYFHNSHPTPSHERCWIFSFHISNFKGYERNHKKTFDGILQEDKSKAWKNHYVQVILRFINFENLESISFNGSTGVVSLMRCQSKGHLLEYGL